MANRSDMQAALPRHIKRYLTMGKWADAHEYGAIKRMMIDSQNVYLFEEIQSNYRYQEYYDLKLYFQYQLFLLQQLNNYNLTILLFPGQPS